MKVVILAGGLGTRLSEETDLKPKPMVEIGGKPILWHIMKIYSYYGFNDFIICCGYKGYMIKEYFANYFLHQADITVDLCKNSIEIHQSKAEPWRITLVDTGLNTMTGGRIKRIREFTENSTFMLTYGDGVSDLNIKKLVDFHRENNSIATVTAVQQSAGRFGALGLDGDVTVHKFTEKPASEGVWINGGFFVLEPRIFDYIDGDSTIWEKEPLEKLAMNNDLKAYKHKGFWRPMDTLRDRIELEEMWHKGSAKWRIW
jgi:glucose-1-phosphate cytidylyltransferase